VFPPGRSTVGRRALHTQAESVLRPAHQTAVALGAAPLRREIELLAKRGRLRLEQPVETPAAPTAPSSAAVSLGLTQRELEVLVLVAEGQTNRQIGQTLFITPKTAGVHVSRILAKLGVTGRGKRPRSLTASASTSNDPHRPLLLFSAWQRMRLTECGQFGVITLAAPTRASRDSGCSPGRVDVSTRSNALYDRCATEEASRK
jgi:DNA-binding CsgD family transcriptional regulator